MLLWNWCVFCLSYLESHRGVVYGYLQLTWQDIKSDVFSLVEWHLEHEQ